MSDSNLTIVIEYLSFYFILYLRVFPGSLTLVMMRTALWDSRSKWFDVGLELDLPYRTLQVIEGHTVSQHYLYGYVLYTCMCNYPRPCCGQQV